MGEGVEESALCRDVRREDFAGYVSLTGTVRSESLYQLLIVDTQIHTIAYAKLTVHSKCIISWRIG